MKTLLQIVLLLTVVWSIDAQTSEWGPDSVYTEQAKYDVYIYEVYDDFIAVEKQLEPGQREFLIVNDAYLKKQQRGIRPVYYDLHNVEACIRSISQNIRPYVMEPVHQKKVFLMKLILNLSGRVKNVHFEYPSNLSIPATALEQLALDIEKNCYATFEMTEHAKEVLKGADNLPFYFGFYLDEIYYDTMDAEDKEYRYRLF